MTRSRARTIVTICVAGLGLAWLLLASRLRQRRPNVILISIDTCRADRLGCYGHDENTTPNIDAVAQEGVLFENTISPVPLTLPAHCSMMSGLIPPLHGVRDNINYRLGASKTTLAERLSDHGYQTAATIGAFVLDAQTGIDQGFDSYDDRLVAGAAAAGNRPERRAAELTRLANGWLERQATAPFFLFLHYYDPHDPYDPPEPFASRFRADAYAGEIAYTDSEVGKVLAKLRELDFYESSLIIITSDHGEALGDHGETTHGYFIYHSTTQVPLIIKPPGAGEPRRVARPSSLVDIVPTVLTQCGLIVPPDLHGRDLLKTPPTPSSESGRRFVYTESLLATKYDCSPLFGLEDASWSYIHSSAPELYDLVEDPHQQHNVIDQNAETARSLRNRLAALLDQSTSTQGDDTTLDMDSESLARLQSLGYTGGIVEATFELESQRQAPADFLEVHNALEQMDRATQAKDYLSAQRIGHDILTDRPNLVDVHRRMGLIAIEQRDPEAAIYHYSSALELEPNARDAPLWHNNLGILVARKGIYDEAADHFHAAIRMVRDEVAPQGDEDVDNKRRRGAAGLVLSARMNLGDLRLRQERLEDAAEEYRHAISVAPQNPGPHYQLGMALSRLGRPKEAEEAFRHAKLLQSNRATNSTGESSRRSDSRRRGP